MDVCYQLKLLMARTHIAPTMGRIIQIPIGQHPAGKTAISMLARTMCVTVQEGGGVVLLAPLLYR